MPNDFFDNLPAASEDDFFSSLPAEKPREVGLKSSHELTPLLPSHVTAQDQAKAVKTVTDTAYFRHVMGIPMKEETVFQFPLDDTHPEAKNLQSFSGMVVNHWDSTQRAIERADLFSQRNTRLMLGQSTIDLDEQLGALGKVEKFRKPANPLEKAVAFTAEQVPYFVDTIKEGSRLGMATAIVGTAGYLAGTGGTGLPVAPAVFSSLYGAGAMVGSSKRLWEVAEGMSFEEMTDRGINEQDAMLTSRFVVGPLSATLNTIGLHQVSKVIPGMDKILGVATQKASASIARTVPQIIRKNITEVGKAVSVETLTENLDELAQVAGSQIGIEVTNAFDNKGLSGVTVDEIKERMLAVTEATIYATATMGGIGGAVGTVLDVSSIKGEAKQREKIVDTIETAMEKTEPATREAARGAGSVVVGVNENKDGVVTGILMADRKTGKLFETGPNPTTEEIASVTGGISEARKTADIQEALLDEIIDDEARETEIANSIFGEDDFTETIENLASDESDIEAVADEIFGKEEKVSRSISEIAKDINATLGETGAIGKGFDPAAVNILVKELGQSAWDSGARTFEQFAATVKEQAGQAWETIKEIAAEIWETIKSFNEGLGEEGAVGKDIKAKKRIREKTGQVDLSANVTEKKALRASFVKAAQNARIAYREGKKDGLAAAKKEMAEAVKARVRRTTGQTDTSKMVSERTALKAAFTKAAQAARAAKREGKLEASEKAKAEMRATLETMRAKQSDAQFRKKIIKQLENVKKKGMKSGTIALDYKRKIDELLDGFDFAKLSKKKRGQLESLADYLEKEGQPLGIQQATITEIKRLARLPLADLTTEDVASLKDQVKKLQALGRLKLKLMKFADARERQEKITALVAGTVNLDRLPPKTRFQSKMSRGRADIFKDMLQNVYMETLHTFRVTDMMDGFNKYGGENTKLIKAQNEASQNAQLEGQRRIDSAIDQISELGIAELSELDQARVMAHIRFMERADEQVLTLAEQYGFDVPEGITTTEELKQYIPLSDEEQKLIEIIRGIVTEKTADIAALHEELTNSPFERIDGYVLPLLYERTAAIEPSAVIQENFNEAGGTAGPIRTKRTSQGFTKSRTSGVRKIPRIDLFGIMEEAINAQEWYLNVQPVLLNAADLVFSKEYTEAGGTVAANWWRDQIDIMARHGWKAGYKSSALGRGMQTARGNLNRAVLLFKASTIMMQPFAVIDAMAFAKAKYGSEMAAEIAKEFAKSWVSPAYAEKLVASSKALKLRKGGELAIEEVLTEAARTDKWFKKLEEVGGSLVSGADLKTAAGVRQGILNVLERNGVPDAGKEADFIMGVSQGSTDVAMRPHILGSGEGARTWFTFQNFALNRWGIVVHDMIKGGVASGDFANRSNALIGLMVLMAGGMLEDEARKLLRELLGKKTKGKESSLLVDVLTYVPRQTPFLGDILENSMRGFGSTEPPVVRTISTGVSGAVDIGKGKIARGSLKMGESALTLYWGIPGTSQLFDFLEMAIPKEKKF